MDKEKYILDKITEYAKKQARKHEEDSKKKLALLFKQSEKEIEENRIKTMDEYKTEFDFTVSQNIATTQLELKKQTLKQKQEILNTVFDNARKEILSLKDKDYLKLIKGLIKENCENNDEIIVCTRDKTKITEAFIKNIATSEKKNLKRSVSDDFEGGIIISNKDFDKVLTLDKLMQSIRNEIEKDVIKILFSNA